MIEEQYVSFETAKLLKEKGFNEHCFCAYHEDKKELEHFSYSVNNYTAYDEWITAPTQQMAMRWLREVKEIFISTYPTETAGICAAIYKYGATKPCMVMCKRNKHEEACEAAIKYCLENLICCDYENVLFM